MKFDLTKMLAEILEDEAVGREMPQRVLTQDEIRHLAQQRRSARRTPQHPAEQPNEGGA